MRANRRDQNEKSIVQYWRQIGCLWIPMQPGQGFDGLLIGNNGGKWIVEIKNPEERLILTECERTLKNNIEIRGGCYHIIQTLAEAATLIGMELEAK